jgi:hypothetical protein
VLLWSPTPTDVTPIPPFDTALARIHDVFVFYQSFPSVLVHSLELEDCTRDAARVALDARMPFPAVCAEFGRVAAESLPHERLAAIAVARAMAKWAATVYRQSPIIDAAAS